MENSIEFFLNTHLEWSLSHQGFAITYVPSYRVVIGVPQRKAMNMDLFVEYSRNSISKLSDLHDEHSHRAF